MKKMVATLFIAFFLPVTVGAAVPGRYTNDNFLLSEHDQPVSLFQDGLGGFYGYTLTGKLYTQQPIANIYSIKLHKFVIDDAWFYMSDRGLIQADNDLIALSVYFARASALPV